MNEQVRGDPADPADVRPTASVERDVYRRANNPRLIVAPICLDLVKIRYARVNMFLRRSTTSHKRNQI